MVFEKFRESARISTVSGPEMVLDVLRCRVAALFVEAERANKSGQRFVPFCESSVLRRGPFSVRTSPRYFFVIQVAGFAELFAPMLVTEAAHLQGEAMSTTRANLFFDQLVMRSRYLRRFGWVFPTARRIKNTVRIGLQAGLSAAC